MDDKAIVGLFFARDEAAITAASEKYGSYCTAIARKILQNEEDAAECVNDTWLGAWNAIPPHRPNVLSAFLGKITRNLSLNRYKQLHAEKRNAVIVELAECLSGDDASDALDRQELLRAIDRFLAGLTSEKRGFFVCRYWYFDSVREIALRCGRSETYVSVMLNRLRAKLREFLKQEGFEV